VGVTCGTYNVASVNATQLTCLGCEPSTSWEEMYICNDGAVKYAYSSHLVRSIAVGHSVEGAYIS